MLALHPVCERCDARLPPSAEAYVCSFECTFCPACNASFGGVCPNRGGDLQRRPGRTGGKLGFRAFGPYRPDPKHADPCYRVVVRDAAWLPLNSFPGDRQAPGHVYLRVRDLDAIEAEVRAAGLIPALAATDQTWGTREMVVHDPDGNALHFHRE